MNIDIYYDEIIEAINQVAESTFRDLADYAQSYIVEEKREFPRTTYRKVGAGVTGKIATTPRDVVDTGKLRDSFNVNVKLDPNTVLIATWSTPYIETIYMGTANTPAYPFVNLAIDSFDLIQVFDQHWNKLTL